MLRAPLPGRTRPPPADIINNKTRDRCVGSISTQSGVSIVFVVPELTKAENGMTTAAAAIAMAMLIATAVIGMVIAALAAVIQAALDTLRLVVPAVIAVIILMLLVITAHR